MYNSELRRKQKSENQKNCCRKLQNTTTRLNLNLTRVDSALSLISQHLENIHSQFPDLMKSWFDPSVFLSILIRTSVPPLALLLLECFPDLLLIFSYIHPAHIFLWKAHVLSILHPDCVMQQRASNP